MLHLEGDGLLSLKAIAENPLLRPQTRGTNIVITAFSIWQQQHKRNNLTNVAALPFSDVAHEIFVFACRQLCLTCKVCMQFLVISTLSLQRLMQPQDLLKPAAVQQFVKQQCATS